MSGTIDTLAAQSIDEALHLLGEELNDLIATGIPEEIRQSNRQILRLKVPIISSKSLSWLRGSKATTRIYWRDRSGREEIAAIGVAENISLEQYENLASLFEHVNNRLDGQDQQVRYWGGFRFNPESKQQNGCWKSFGKGQLILPRLELQHSDNGSFLACNILIDETDELKPNSLTEWYDGDKGNCESAELPTVISRQDTPDSDNWQSNVTYTTDLINSGKLDKLVLARMSNISMEGRIDPWTILERLRRNSSECFLFGLQLNGSAAFVGASPEQLYFRQGAAISTEAIAGTRPRGKEQSDDERLADELLGSEKDGREHESVVRGIEEALRPLCDSLSYDDEHSLLKLAKVQHLLTRFQGKIKATTGDAEILKSLHPTPAVGGYPSSKALQLLEELESFDRGWYAGPIGWVSSSSAQFVVAIRCGLVTDKQLAIFSGAGLVEGSNAQSEWQEIEDKISNFLTAIGS